MKIQKAAGTRRTRGGENLRFSPGNWAHAQFLMNGMPPSGGGKERRRKPAVFSRESGICPIPHRFSAAEAAAERGRRNGKNENAGGDASRQQHSGDEGV